MIDKLSAKTVNVMSFVRVRYYLHISIVTTHISHNKAVHKGKVVFWLSNTLELVYSVTSTGLHSEVTCGMEYGVCNMQYGV